MPLTCQAFVENAWKKDLCANCFKSVDEHKTEVARKSLTGKDSLSDLEQGTNRYLSVTGSCLAGNSRYRKQIREVVRKNAGNCKILIRFQLLLTACLKVNFSLVLWQPATIISFSQF